VPWLIILRLLAHDVEDGVDELSALGVVALGPVVAGARLAKDKVVWAEDLAEWARADGVHGARLEVHEDVALKSFFPQLKHHPKYKTI